MPVQGVDMINGDAAGNVGGCLRVLHVTAFSLEGLRIAGCAAVVGGGLWIEDSVGVFTSVALSDTTAQQAGAILVRGGDVRLFGSTIEDVSLSARGATQARGGAIMIMIDGDVTLDHCRISSVRVSAEGSALGGKTSSAGSSSAPGQRLCTCSNSRRHCE